MKKVILIRHAKSSWKEVHLSDFDRPLNKRGIRDSKFMSLELSNKIDSVDVYITTPQFNPTSDEYVAVSNGLELSQVVNGANKTTRYKHRYPIPAYLIAIAAPASPNKPKNFSSFKSINLLIMSPVNKSPLDFIFFEIKKAVYKPYTKPEHPKGIS